MSSEYWLCERCHSLNAPIAGHCYSCGTPRSVPPSEPDPDPLSGGGGPPAPSRSSPRSAAYAAAALMVLAGALGALVLTAWLTPPSGREVTTAAEPSPGAVSPAPAISPAPATSTPGAAVATTAPAPSPSPTPAFTPYRGRFSGTWLLTPQPGPDAVAAGVYRSEVLLRVRPKCTSGACAVSASLVNPRTGKVLATATVRRTAIGYRIKLKASVRDQCRGADGRTVQDGATRSTSFILRPFDPAGGGDTFLATSGTIRLNPNTRGDSVGCRDGSYGVEVKPAKLSKTDIASIKGRLSSVPPPDLVPRPDFAVTIKGVRSIYYPVKGDGARELAERWSATSTKKKYCGTIHYEWKTGSRRTMSCIKSSSDPKWSYVQDPWTGSCTITGIKMNWSMSMPIARWAGPSLVPRGLVRWWKETQRFVRDHEAGHVAIYRKWIPKLRARVTGASCASASSIAKRWSNEVSAAQEAYDKREYGRTDWPPYPPDAP